MLGLPFPGGPNIERAAQMGNATAYKFPRSKRDDSYDFSFSGLKTAVMREVTVPQPTDGGKKRGPEKNPKVRSDVSVNDVAASFQDALVSALVDKTVRAAEAYKVSEIFLAGGVSANSALRQRVRAESSLPVRYPPLNLCTDNGAMIAAAGYFRYEAGLRSDLDLDVQPMWPLTSEAYGNS
jgi:N6-L-threonylcarbamoyladenine synthase